MELNKKQQDTLQEITASILDLGQHVLTLFRQNQLANPDLLARCEQIKHLESTLHAEMTPVKLSLGDIGAENTPPIGDTPAMPVSINQPIIVTENDLQASSSRLVLEMDPQDSSERCHYCKHTLRTGVNFCTQCGQKVILDTHIVLHPPAETNDSTPLPTDATELVSIPSRHPPNEAPESNDLPSPENNLTCASCHNPLELGDAHCTNCGQRVSQNLTMPMTPDMERQYGLDPDYDDPKRTCHVCHEFVEDDITVCPTCGNQNLS